jgi:AcrR family transcriptional regulator
MSRRSFYNYFSSKEEAFRACVRWSNAHDITFGQAAVYCGCPHDDHALGAAFRAGI